MYAHLKGGYFMAIDKDTQTISNVIGISLTTGEDNTLYLVFSIQFIKMNDTRRNSATCFVPYKSRIEQKWQEDALYPLREVTAKELFTLRISEIPGIVYKKNDKLFYSEIPGTISLNNKSGYFNHHSCGNYCSKVCTECPRTFDLSVSYQQRLGTASFPKAVFDSWRIEKYAFIREGLETFNMYDSDEFIVLQCDNYISKVSSIKIEK